MLTKIVSILLVLSITIACRGTNSSNQNTPVLADTSSTLIATVAPPEIVVKDTPVTEMKTVDELAINYIDSIDFEKYKINPQKRMANAPIDWSSYPEAKDFKTRITEAYKNSEVNFSGHYVTSVFGCGSSCIMGFMVDVRDGKIYDLPLGEENSCLFAEDRALYDRMSRLFIAGVCKKNLEDKKVYYKAYLWNEDKKEFHPIEENQFMKSK
jgi:hypothetical protein